jgi:YbgC/YbaW family acyl-CoA thioester hydrolase
MNRQSEHTMRRRVNFYECDPARIVHFSNFYRYMEEAEHAFWRAAGLTLTAVHHLGFPRVSATFDFHAPLHYDDAFEVTLRIAAMGRTSIRYACVITRGDTTIATGAMTMVCVEVGPPMRAVPVPDELRDRVEIATPPSA